MSTDRPGALRLAAMEGQRRDRSPVRDLLEDRVGGKHVYAEDALDAALRNGHDIDDGSLDLGGTVTETSLILPAGLPFEQWQQVGFRLRRINRAWRWWVGDWLNYGERAYGEMYSQAMEETGLPYHSLAQCVYVAKHVEPSMRREGLSWGHHEAVASLPKADQTALLDRAESHGWKREHLRAAVSVIKEPDKLSPAVTLATICQCHCHVPADNCDCGSSCGPLA